MYFSMLPNQYEQILKDEIWGMFKHMGIPMETVMSMPIQDRKYYIQKHNYEQEGISREMENRRQGNTNTIVGNVNEFAKQEQINKKNGLG